MRKIINTNIRFNLENEADRKAWEHLRNMDRKKYKSYTKAVVAALNDYFDRQERLDADAYLETREKEDAFLKRILDTIEQGLKASSANNAVGNLLQLLAVSTPKETTVQELNAADDTDMDAALEFADSF